jgi:outer membrane lipoprotein-sorting protein
MGVMPRRRSRIRIAANLIQPQSDTRVSLMRLILLAVATLVSFTDIALAQTLAQIPGQPGGMQPPEIQRRTRQRPAEAQPQQTPAQQQMAADPVVAQVEQYFNSIRSMQARFVQNNPNGSIVHGTVYLRRPGRMRFEYDAPSALKIVADGSQVTMWDVKTNDFGQWPIGWTAASFLVKDQLRLSGEDLRVENVERSNGMIAVTMTQTKKPTEGKVTVRVSDGGAMQLRGWTIVDSRGHRVDVALSNVQSGAQLADSLFKFDGPDPSQNRRN